MPLPVGALACFHPVSPSSSWNGVHACSISFILDQSAAPSPSFQPLSGFAVGSPPYLFCSACWNHCSLVRKSCHPLNLLPRTAPPSSKPVESRSPLRPHLPDPLRRIRGPSAWPLEGQLPACCPVVPRERGFTAFFVNLPTFFPPPPVPDVVLTVLTGIVACFEHWGPAQYGNVLLTNFPFYIKGSKGNVVLPPRIFDTYDDIKETSSWNIKEHPRPLLKKVTNFRLYYG